MKEKENYRKTKISKRKFRGKKQVKNSMIFKSDKKKCFCQDMTLFYNHWNWKKFLSYHSGFNNFLTFFIDFFFLPINFLGIHFPSFFGRQPIIVLFLAHKSLCGSVRVCTFLCFINFLCSIVNFILTNFPIFLSCLSSKPYHPYIFSSYKHSPTPAFSITIIIIFPFFLAFLSIFVFGL